MELHDVYFWIVKIYLSKKTKPKLYKYSLKIRKIIAI